jgi:hypothetical protein
MVNNDRLEWITDRVIIRSVIHSGICFMEY